MVSLRCPTFEYPDIVKAYTMVRNNDVLMRCGEKWGQFVAEKTYQLSEMNRDSEGLERASSRQHLSLFSNEQHTIAVEKLVRYSNREKHLAHEQVVNEESLLVKMELFGETYNDEVTEDHCRMSFLEYASTKRDAFIRYGIRLAELTNLNRLDNSYPMSVLRTQTIENVITENSAFEGTIYEKNYKLLYQHGELRKVGIAINKTLGVLSVQYVLHKKKKKN